LILSEAPLEKPKKDKEISSLWVILFVIVLFIGMYGYSTYDLANKAVDSINLENSKFQVIDVKLLPPSATTRLTGLIYNSSNENIYVSGKIDYYVKGTYVNSFIIQNQMILAHSTSTINVDQVITVSSLISMLTSGGTYTYQGHIEAQCTILGFIQIKVNKTVYGST
jgi:hypothetical protein